MEIREWANSRLCESVSDLYRVKIRLGKFKAVIKEIIKRETICLVGQNIN